MVRDSLEMSHSTPFPPSESDDDFAEMPPAFHISQGVGHLSERKCSIDHRPQPIVFYGFVHFFKHLARANENALYTNRFHQDTSWVKLAGACQDTDNRHVTCDAHRV